jgi:hypothetical protein
MKSLTASGEVLISKPGGVISVSVDLPERFKRDLAQQLVNRFFFLGLSDGHRRFLATPYLPQTGRLLGRLLLPTTTRMAPAKGLGYFSR